MNEFETARKCFQEAIAEGNLRHRAGQWGIAFNRAVINGVELPEFFFYPTEEAAREAAKRKWQEGTAYFIARVPRLEDQPLPEGNPEHPCIQDLVIMDMEKRKEVGKSRYGTYLQPFNGRDSLRDAYEEALDLAVYLRQCLFEQTYWREDDKLKVGIASHDRYWESLREAQIKGYQTIQEQNLSEQLRDTQQLCEILKESFDNVRKEVALLREIATPPLKAEVMEDGSILIRMIKSDTNFSEGGEISLTYKTGTMKEKES